MYIHTHTHTTHTYTPTHTHTTPSPSVHTSLSLEQALSHLHPSPLTPRGETQEKVKEDVWDMYFSENGRYCTYYNYTYT